MWTKRQLLMQSFDEIGLADYEFDIQPEEVQSALRRMDALMALWETKGIRVGYNFPANPLESDPDQESGVADFAVEPLVLNLALKIAPSYGKTVSPDTRIGARDAYLALISRTLYVPQMQMPQTMPVGAGNRPWGILPGNYYPIPDENPLVITQGDDLQILPE